MTFQSKLLSWFDANKRPLPWRRHYRPYEVWVSEIMLQQTQVATMLPYFRKWMKRFPTLAALAGAGEHEVLKAWQGLGYYSRARNLHATAKLIMDMFGGVFPDDFETIRGLKGVGPYTAGAIASIAFNQNRPIVDGNVIRVLSRVYALGGSADLWELQEALIPAGKAREFNQSLMELGALVCLKKNPLCGSCPVRGYCLARKRGQIDKYPVPRKRAKTVRVDAAALVLEREGRFFIHRRPVGGIMGGLWEFPEWKNALKPRPASLGIRVGATEPLGTIKRNYTHHLEKLRVFRAASNGSAPKSAWPSAWATKREFKNYPFSSAHAKIAALIA